MPRNLNKSDSAPSSLKDPGPKQIQFPQVNLPKGGGAITNSKIIQFGYCDSLKKGLLSGDKLMSDLRAVPKPNE